MNLAAKHIAYLMPTRNCLSLAGIGTFELLELPAVYNPELHTVSAPSVSVAFEYNSEVATSDVLVDSVCRAQQCTPVEATTMLERDGRAMAQSIRADGSFEIENLGTLAVDKNGEIKLHPAADFVDAYATLWLPRLELTPLVRAEQPAKVTEPRAKIPADTFRRTLRIASSWAAAIIIFGVVALVTTVTNRYFDTNSVNTASTMPARTTTAIDMPAPTPVAPLLLVFRTPADGVDSVAPRPAAPERRQPITEASYDGPYCLIVASLATAAEANEFIAYHSTAELPLFLLETQGRYRIYALAGASAASVLAQADDLGIRNSYPNAWVCRR